MDGSHTVTSHLKHRAANDGVTWNSHCKHNTLGPILPFPALEIMLDVPRALLGQVLKIPAQKKPTYQQGKDSKHRVGFAQAGIWTRCSQGWQESIPAGRLWGRAGGKALSAMLQSMASLAALSWTNISGKYMEFSMAKSDPRLEMLLSHRGALCCWQTTGAAAVLPPHFPALTLCMCRTWCCRGWEPHFTP